PPPARWRGRRRAGPASRRPRSRPTRPGRSPGRTPSAGAPRPRATRRPGTPAPGPGARPGPVWRRSARAILHCMGTATLHYEDSQVEITRLVVGPVANNVFVVRCRETGEAALLDAANEHEKLLEL